MNTGDRGRPAAQPPILPTLVDDFGRGVVGGPVKGP